MDLEADLEHCRKFIWHPEETHLAKEFKNQSGLLKKPLSTNKNVPGNIHLPKFLSFWKDELKVSDYFVRFLTDGYVLPFKDDIPPPEASADNNKSFYDHEDFGIEEILRLEKLGCIYRVKDKPKIVMPFSVVHSGKWRLVGDASRHINPYLLERHVKLETLDDAELLVETGDFQAISDLDSGYWHIKIHEDYQKYLGVHYVDKEGVVHYFQWRVLFLGLSDAVRLFTKVLKPIRAYLFRHGIRHNLYIDDLRVLGISLEDCTKKNKFALDALKSAGWIIKEEKSTAPVQVAKFLGQISDLKQMRYFCPENKKTKILEEIDCLMKKKSVHVKQLAKIYGKLVANRHSLGDIVRLMTRGGFRVIAQAFSWKSYVDVTEEVKFELEFFKKNWEKFDGCPIRNDKSKMVVKGSEVEVASDASEVGLFVYEVKWGSFAWKRPLTPQEAEQSSTSRELMAFEDFYTHYGEKLRGQSVVHYTDSDNVAKMLQIGSRTPSLNNRVRSLFLQLKELDISHVAIWVPREDPRIKIADKGSRDFDTESWMIDIVSFRQLQACWGPFTVDVFAAEDNARVEKFYTKEDSAFCKSFRGEYVWACPPPRLIIPAVRIFARDGARGVLCFPFWESAPFWVAMCPDGVHVANYVQEFRIFRPYFLASPDMVNTAFKGRSDFNMVAMRCDFRVTKPFNPRRGEQFVLKNFL